MLRCLLINFFVILLIGFAPVSLAASENRRERTEVGKPQAGKVCFGYAPQDQQCVSIMAGDRRLGEGPLAGASEWIIEIKSPEGRTISRVGAGGDIIVFSPHAFAKREPGQRTYTIERMDRRTRPIRTNFVKIGTFLTRTGSNWWQGPQGAFGMTEIPAAIDPAFDLRGRVSAAGRVTGIARDGSLTETYENVAAVQYYNDFNVLTFHAYKEVTIPPQPWEARSRYYVPRTTQISDHLVTDADFRAVSPKTDKIVAFLPAFLRQQGGRETEYGLTADSPIAPITFGVDRGTEVNGRKLYSLLPRFANEASRPDFLGVVALEIGKPDYRGRPIGLVEYQTMKRIAGFAGIWATPNGPEMSFVRFSGEPLNKKRYRSVTWSGSIAVLEELTGEARVLMPVFDYGPPDFELSVGTFPSRQAAINSQGEHLSKFSQERQQIVRNQLAGERAERESQERERQYLQQQQALRERERQAALEAGQRERQRLAIVGAAEANRMRELLKIGPDQWQTVCNEAYSMETYYAQSHAVAHCNSIRPRPTYTAQKQDFWGQLGAAIDGWASLSAANGARPPTPAATPQGVSPDWDYARSARAIDNTVRTVTDPNWNGAAVQASPR